jgi:hypothetical protein
MQMHTDGTLQNFRASKQMNLTPELQEFLFVAANRHENTY